MPRRTQVLSRRLPRFRLRGFHPLRLTFPDHSTIMSLDFFDSPITPSCDGLGSSTFARHYLRNRFYFPLLQVLRCFSSLRLAFIHYLFMHEYHPAWDDGFPHSDIDGSLPAYCSPSRFAVRCVLLRLFVPRHSPYALSYLTYWCA